MPPGAEALGAESAGGSAVGAGHISLAEIMIVRELLSRDSLDDATKSTLLQQVFDQKIEGVLRAERQRATWELESEREALASQHKSNVCIVQQRLQAALEEARQLRETVTAERAQAAAARAAAEEERFRTKAERAKASAAESGAAQERAAGASRVEAAETEAQAARQHAAALRVELRTAQEGWEQTRRELEATKTVAEAAAVSQRLLQAYKAEKERCQADLAATSAALASSHRQAQEDITQLEARLEILAKSLHGLQTTLLATGHRRPRPVAVCTCRCRPNASGAEASLPAATATIALAAAGELSARNTPRPERDSRSAPAMLAPPATNTAVEGGDRAGADEDRGVEAGRVGRLSAHNPGTMGACTANAARRSSPPDGAEVSRHSVPSHAGPRRSAWTAAETLDRESLIGKRVRKEFFDEAGVSLGVFKGNVVMWAGVTDTYRIVYEDDDEEVLAFDETYALVRASERGSLTQHPTSAGPRAHHSTRSEARTSAYVSTQRSTSAGPRTGGGGGAASGIGGITARATPRASGRAAIGASGGERGSLDDFLAASGSFPTSEWIFGKAGLGRGGGALGGGVEPAQGATPAAKKQKLAHIAANPAYSPLTVRQYTPPP